MGDYRKNQGQMLNPQQDLTLWVLPSPAARLLCRMIIYGKPLEVRLVQQMHSEEAATVHRSMIGACDGKPLKSTKLGILTNACLFQHQCPGVHDMRHVREHFSTEMMLEVAATSSKGSRALQDHLQEVAAIASNHSFKTSKEVYAGVFERNSVGGLRLIDCREKLEFSRMFNKVVLGFDNVKIASGHKDPTTQHTHVLSPDHDSMQSAKVTSMHDANVLSHMDRSDIVYQAVDSIHSSKEISTQRAGVLSQTFLSQEFFMEAEIQFVRLSVCMYDTGKILISLIRNLQRPSLQTA